MKKLIMTMLLGLALAIPTSLVTSSSPARADSFNTNFSMQYGLSVPWGWYYQINFTKSVSNQMKHQMVAGATVAAVAAYACGKVPVGWVTQASCVVWVAANAGWTREAVNDAYASGNRCVAMRWYTNGPANSVARHVDDVTCNFGIQCCAGGSSGGGGGGGGGSWRQEQRHPILRSVTMGANRHPADDGGGSGGGGGSW